MGDGRAEGSSAMGDGGQTAVSFMPDIDSPGFGSLLDSVLSTLLKKESSDVWVVAFSLVTDALDCIPNGFVPHLGPESQKLTVSPQIKKTPLPFPAS